jgi:ATP-dependent DNA helicase RecQ
MNKNDILKQYFGHMEFRQGQSDLIDSILSGRDVFGLMPTGAGKSVCYQVPALMLEGITLVVSPLISLMKDQVNALVQSGVKGAYINSSLSAGQNAEVLRRAANGAYKIIYIAPERLVTDDFIRFAQQTKISLVTVDEAHCVSQWGQNFRPSYLKIVQFIERLSYRPIISAFTATATQKVREDIIGLLGLKKPMVVTTGFDRQNLYFEVQKPKNKLSALLELLKKNRDRIGIVYCSTRKVVETVCEELNKNNFRATRYHAGLSDAERFANQDDFIFDRKTVMVATNAFGMGIDKSNVSFVVHYNMPMNLESYYQEAGRAGRDGEVAECILFYSGQDVRTNLFLIENNRDINEDLTEEMRELVKQKDRERLKIITYYCTTADCLREYILRYFGENAPDFCGNCSNCNAHFETVDITIEAQKIVSAVIGLAQENRSFGKMKIIQILRGSENGQTKQYGLTNLAAYGTMAKIPIHRIRMILNYLIENGYLSLSNDEYPVVGLTERSSEIIPEKRKLEMKLPLQDKPDEPQKGGPLFKVDTVLFAALKALRNQLASENHVPSYIIFSDAALRDMCSKLPQTSEEFLRVSGVGAVKLERFGESFVDLIREYVSNEIDKIK